MLLPLLCICCALPSTSMVCSPASSKALQMRLQRYLSCCATLMYQQQAARTALVMTSYRCALSQSDHVQFRLAAYAGQADPVPSLYFARIAHLACAKVCRALGDLHQSVGLLVEYITHNVLTIAIYSERLPTVLFPAPSCGNTVMVPEAQGTLLCVITTQYLSAWPAG